MIKNGFNPINVFRLLYSDWLDSPPFERSLNL